jgi:hypothetical protein
VLQSFMPYTTEYKVGDGWLALRSGRFTPGGKSPLDRGLGGP